MEPTAARRMLDQLAGALPRDGYLVLGAGEQASAPATPSGRCGDGRLRAATRRSRRRPEHAALNDKSPAESGALATFARSR